jgi:hypothetical protein
MSGIEQVISCYMREPSTTFLYHSYRAKIRNPSLYLLVFIFCGQDRLVVCSQQTGEASGSHLGGGHVAPPPHPVVVF